jgi:4-amino-4-deoxy-L-arabinose transferase-like glycosyltransferase
MPVSPPLSRRLPFAFPPRGAVLAALCALYLLPGLIGHDPWKSDDATHFGVIYSLLGGGDWLLPRLAGEAWLDSPPLYYWVAALFAKAFGLLLPLHDAARLASGFFGALMLAFLAGAARQLGHRDPAPATALVAIGCLGLLVHVHDIQPATAFLAAAAATYYGIALLPHDPLRGGAIAGAALGCGFMAAGLPMLLTLGPLLMLLPLVSTHLRTPQAARGALAALAVVAPLVLAWPLALYWREPAALDLWWANEMADLRPARNLPAALWEYLQLLGWFAWPALPLAAWTLWKERRRLGEPRILIPLFSFAVTLAVQTAFFEPRGLNALPLLPPLILLAVPATASLRRGAANAFDWFGMMTFTLVGGLVWLGWIAMVAGVPAQVARNFAKLEPGFVAQFSMPAFVAALALSLAWLWLIFGSPRSSQRGTVHWAAGVVLVWGLLMALWLPWIDYGKSYRPVGAALKAALPPHAGCIAGRDLGDAQRASFHYFSGIMTKREGSKAAAQCKLFLTQSTSRTEDLPRGAGWRKIWEGHRRGDRVERFRLYQQE